ncbi:MAG TPA: histidinol dehydrogenase [Steroidobacteraceae bacterium]|nr:histidinol dehydrogenase [Steroidobacteraceae bacterium]
MRILEWKSLSACERSAALQRPAQRDAASVVASAREIIDRVRRDGDAALRELSEQFDAVRPEVLQVSAREFELADRRLGAAQHAAIEQAIGGISRFHSAQAPAPVRVETFPGVVCERISVPIRAAGLYVPAGSAPLPSTALMLAVPATLSGCPIRIMCTPPNRDGAAHPAVLVAARKAGVEQVFKVGGAQAIAAMAYGTATIPKCDKIYGPGNAYVTAAKMLVAQDAAGAAQDLPAGPSEIMIIADDDARAEFVAADLLAQAEHGIDAQALLLTTHRPLAYAVHEAVLRQCARLSRADILAQSVRSMRLIVVESLQSALEIADLYAPEHLILEVREPRACVSRIRSAGAVFLGHWSPESAGDYCSGPNHTLPTYGFARAHSGLSLEDFQRRISIQELTPAGLKTLAPITEILAGLEGLDAHAAAVTIRMEALN